MSPTPFHSNILNNHHHALCRPPPLKVHKDSHHSFKKSSPPAPPLLPSSSSSSSSVVSGSKPHQQQQRRQPVIIYTHSPKVIHTNPRDFMALVQKLTGLSRSSQNNNNNAAEPKQEALNYAATSTLTVDVRKGLGNEENETTSSVITEEEHNCSSSIGEITQVNSCFMTNPTTSMHHLDPLLNNNPYMANLPVVFPTSNSPAQFLSYDPLFFPHNNIMMRTSMNPTSTPTLGGLHDFRRGHP